MIILIRPLVQAMQQGDTLLHHIAIDRTFIGLSSDHSWRSVNPFLIIWDIKGV